VITTSICSILKKGGKLAAEGLGGAEMCVFVEMKGERVWLFNQGSKDLLGFGKQSHDREWGEGRGITSNRTTKNNGAINQTRRRQQRWSKGLSVSVQQNA